MPHLGPCWSVCKKVSAEARGGASSGIAVADADCLLLCAFACLVLVLGEHKSTPKVAARRRRLAWGCGGGWGGGACMGQEGRGGREEEGGDSGMDVTSDALEIKSAAQQIVHSNHNCTRINARIYTSPPHEIAPWNGRRILPHKQDRCPPLPPPLQLNISKF